MKKILIYILLIVTVLGGCRKVDLPDPVEGTPVFSVNATIDNQPFIWNAGDNDVYLFTEFSKDNLDVYTLTGRFEKDDNCTDDCKEYLSFSIRGNEVTPTVNTFIIESALQDGNYIYFSDSIIPTQTGLRYTLEREEDPQFPTNPFSIYNWTIKTDSGNLISSGTGDTIQFSNIGNSDIEITLEIMNNSGVCTTLFKRKIKNGVNNSQNIEANIVGVNPNSNEIFIEPIFTNFSGVLDSVFFTLHYNTTITSINSNDTFSILLDSFSNSFSLEAFDSVAFDTLGYLEVCISGQPSQPQFSNPKFSYIFEPIFSNNSDQFSTALIEYRDSSGILYHSSKYLDNSNNTFTISEIEDFEVNENGAKTKKFKVNYDCILENDNGETKTLKGESVIAVAYPN